MGLVKGITVKVLGGALEFIQRGRRREGMEVETEGEK